MSSSSLSGRTASGAFWMMLGSGGQTVFQFVLFIVLARQLGPETFGLIGIAVVFIELSSTVGRAGLTEVAIQRPTLDDDDASTAFWSSLAIGLLFTVALLLVAGPLAVGFDEPLLRPVMQWLAPVSALYAVGAVYEAKLRRDFGFKALAARNVTATMASGIVALVLALTGFGVWSLVIQRLIYVVWLLVAMVYSTRWLPRLTWKRDTGVAQLRDGSVIALSSVLGSGNQRIIDLIVGYVLGATALGYLRIAWRALDLLQELSIRQITSVTLTSLSRLQDNREALIAGYLKLVKTTALFAYPMFLGAAVVAPEIITFMFGKQWQLSILPMQVLTLTAIFIPPLFFKSNVLMAAGQMRVVLAVNIFEFVASTIVAYLFARYGLVAAAAGNVARLALVSPVIFVILKSRIGIPIGETISGVLPPLLASGVMVGALTLLKPQLPDLPSLVTIAIMGSIGLLIYLGMLLVVQRDQVMEIVAVVRRLMRRSPTAE
ncbi:MULTISPECIES: lipopolysaccharide biosynthesis protein [unclassified Sphingomonas]|uniref:lipopolysaccharide biosynthesis protein n=1 Tax=unclassified Sphingomonas TaxID=196159 RepID=UPI0009E8F86E|nr:MULTISPECIES: lipopolysaccharide biosynthesis protein [unclassified Sphingomonas]